MIVTPIPRRVEIASPDAHATATSSLLLDPVSSRGDRKPFGHHGSTKIAPGNQTGGKQAIILIYILGAAIGGTSGEQLRHAIARRPAA